jgi:hypothetical protein
MAGFSIQHFPKNLAVSSNPCQDFFIFESGSFMLVTGVATSDPRCGNTGIIFAKACRETFANLAG